MISHNIVIRTAIRYGLYFQWINIGGTAPRFILIVQTLTPGFFYSNLDVSFRFYLINFYMFKGLKIAVRQQKKLLVIFFITIFLPSVSLSIFGIIALRNEKFRLTKQIENEQLQIASDIKSKIETKLTETEERLDNLVNYPSFRQKDFVEIKELLTAGSGKDSLIETVFLLYKNEEIFPVPVSV
jgi:hypothetical protein